MEIRAVIFDMDGVLYDTERLSCVIWQQMADEQGLGDITEVYKGACGLNRRDGLAWLRQNFGQDFDAEGFHAEGMRRLKEKISRDGLPVKTGAREILAYLKRHHIPAAICSSTKQSFIREHLVQTGMEDDFDYIVSGDMVTHSKPDPEIYLCACRTVGFAPGVCMAVEDSPNGIRAASAAGMVTVMVPDLIEPVPELTEKCFRVEKSLLTLKEYLKTLFGD